MEKEKKTTKVIFFDQNGTASIKDMIIGDPCQLLGCERWDHCAIDCNGMRLGLFVNDLFDPNDPINKAATRIQNRFRKSKQLILGNAILYDDDGDFTLEKYEIVRQVVKYK